MQWWCYVVGLKKQDNTSVLKGLANATADANMAQLAENINIFFCSVSPDLPPMPKVNKYSQIEYSPVPDKYILSIGQVEKNLSQIKLGKAPSPEEITSWMLRNLTPVWLLQLHHYSTHRYAMVMCRQYGKVQI